MSIALVAEAQAQGGQVILNPTDDAYTNMNMPNSNYGSSQLLKVCLEYWAWLKFDLSSIPDDAIGIFALLELYTSYNGVTEAHGVPACLMLDNFNNSWSEDTITCSNSPTYIDDLELDIDYVANDETWYEWNVTQAVMSAIANNVSVVTIVMKYPWGQEFPSISFNSKEVSSTKIPKLTISWTDVIPEFPSFLIMPLFTIVTLLAVNVIRRKRSI